MRMLTGPRVLVTVLLCAYLGFLSWYGGRGAALTPAETEQLIAEIKRRAAAGGLLGDGPLLAELRDLAASDDGKEFFMLNLIRFRDQARYPAGSGFGGSGRDADARYGRAIAPYLLKHGNHPVFIGEVEGPFIREASDPEWQRVAIIRYRSRRDMLRMIVELADQDVGIHKWASVERTQAFPARSLFDLGARRSLVAALLILIGFGLHGLLHRRAFYAGRSRSTS